MSELAVLARPRSGVGWLVAAVTLLSVFVLLTVMVVLTGGHDGLDVEISQAVVPIRTDMVSRVASELTNLGSFPVVTAVAVLISLSVGRRTRSWFRPVVGVCAVTITASVVYLVKIAVGRARPGTNTLIGTPSLDYSFPSGHTTDGSVVWLMAALLLALTARRRVTRVLLVLAGMLIAVIVGLTRVYLGYHWATDVVASWCLAGTVVCIAGYVCTRTVERLPEVDLGLAVVEPASAWKRTPR